jgi:hypothetical protein
MEVIVDHHLLIGWMFGIATLNSMFWTFRLAVFRKDRKPNGEFFGQPPSPNWQIYNPANYVPAARWTFRIFLVSSLLFAVAMTGVLVSIAAVDYSNRSAPNFRDQQ